MSQLLRRPASKTPRLFKAKPSFARDEENPESLIAGIILAAIIWPTFVLILWLATRHLGADAHSTPFKPARRPDFNIELSPDEYLMPSKPVPRQPKFVETNPDAPENMPDKTDNVGAQNQQAAQEKPNPNANGDRAATTGKKDFESNQIVSGQLRPPTETPPPAPPPTPEIARALEKAAEARKAESPLPGFEKRVGDSAEGFGMNEAKPSDNPTSAREKVEGQKEAPTTIGPMSPVQVPINPRKPQPRVQLAQQRVRPAIFAENPVGSRNIGPAGIDARWSNYGAYMQKMVDAVQMQFDRLNDESRIFPPTGTVVTIRFRMDKEGKIAEIIASESTGGKQAESLCQTALTSRAPYGVWTDDMVAMLGESQEMVWKFYYGTP